MKLSWTRVLVIAAAAVAAACGLTVSPESGIESISALVLGSPSVVLGDILRDSLGNPAPLVVNAYDGAGKLVSNATAEYFVLDSIPTVHIDATGQVFGDKLDSLGAHVIAQVGSLQTPPRTIFVSVSPDAAAAVGTVGPLLFSIATLDTLSASNWSDTLALNVHNVGGIGAQGFVIRYDIIQSPTPLKAGTTTAYIGNDQGQYEPRDTTDLHGQAHRRVVLKQLAIGDPGLFAGTKTDTIIVRATIRYRGADVPGSPILFMVPVSLHP